VALAPQLPSKITTRALPGYCGVRRIDIMRQGRGRRCSLPLRYRLIVSRLCKHVGIFLRE
jgi:hypothetical protein